MRIISLIFAVFLMLFSIRASSQEVEIFPNAKGNWTCRDLLHTRQKISFNDCSSFLQTEDFLLRIIKYAQSTISYDSTFKDSIQKWSVLFIPPLEYNFLLNVRSNYRNDIAAMLAQFHLKGNNSDNSVIFMLYDSGDNVFITIFHVNGQRIVAYAHRVESNTTLHNFSNVDEFVKSEVKYSIANHLQIYVAGYKNLWLSEYFKEIKANCLRL